MLAKGCSFPRERGKVGMGELEPVHSLMRWLRMEEGQYAPIPTLPRCAGEGAQHHRHEPLDLRMLHWTLVALSIAVMSSSPDWQ